MAAKKKCPSQFYRSAESLFLLLINLFILFLAALGLRCCAWAFSSCGEQGLLFVAVRWASHCSGFSCCGAWALGVWASVLVARGLSSCSSRALERRLRSCGARAYLLCGMWDLPGSSRDQTHVPCIGRWVLHHCATREVPWVSTFMSLLLYFFGLAIVIIFKKKSASSNKYVLEIVSKIGILVKHIIF